jgi:hypothetical protein
MKCHREQCGYEWTPRKQNPRKCPNCQGPLWRSPNRKKKKTVVAEEIRQDIQASPEMETVHDALPEEETSILTRKRSQVEELVRMLS